MGAGVEVFGNCASCHGGSGEGGAGDRWPTARSTRRSRTSRISCGSSTSAPRRTTSPASPTTAIPTARWRPRHRVVRHHAVGATAGGDLTDAEILAVVCHERYAFNGPDPTDDAVAEEYELWCSEESPMYAALEAGTPLADLDTAGITDAEGNATEIIDIGDAPPRAARPRPAIGGTDNLGASPTMPSSSTRPPPPTCPPTRPTLATSSPTCSSSAVGRPAPPPATGSPARATT